MKEQVKQCVTFLFNIKTTTVVGFPTLCHLGWEGIATPPPQFWFRSLNTRLFFENKNQQYYTKNKKGRRSFLWICHSSILQAIAASRCWRIYYRWSRKIKPETRVSTNDSNRRKLIQYSRDHLHYSPTFWRQTRNGKSSNKKSYKAWTKKPAYWFSVFDHHVLAN